MKLFARNTKKPVSSRRVSTSGARIHSYYTPAQQDRIDIDMSSRKAQKKSTRLKTASTRFKQLLGIGCSIVILYLLLALKGQPVINVDTVNSDYSSTRYSAKIQQIFASSIFNSNKLTLQRASIQKQIETAYPELTESEVRYSFVGRRPEVYLKVSSLPYIYEALGVQYSVSQEGRNVGTVAETPADKNPLLIKDESGIQTKKGDMLLTSADSRYFTTVKQSIEAKGRRVEYMRISAIPREVFVKLTDVKYEIKMYLEDDPSSQIGTFFAAEKTLGEGGAAPTQYIDVRAGEKVFWQ